jgi:hypothetical protein
MTKIIIMAIIETLRILRQHVPVFMTDQEVTETVYATEMVIIKLSMDSGMCVGRVHVIIQKVTFLVKIV